MSETICIVNSKICPFNDGGFCIATRDDLLNILDKEICANQGKL